MIDTFIKAITLAVAAAKKPKNTPKKLFYFYEKVYEKMHALPSKKLQKDAFINWKLHIL